MQHVGIRQSSFELLCLMLFDRFTSTLRCSLDLILVCNILLIEHFVWCDDPVYCTQQWGYLPSVSSARITLHVGLIVSVTAVSLVLH